MFDRELPRPFLLGREQLEPELVSAGFRLASDQFDPGAFGSALSEYRGPARRLRIVWDGKDRWLWIQVSRPGKEHPAYNDWSDLEHELGLRPQAIYAVDDHSLARRLSELRAALQAFLASGAA
jgi:hypothetical protein